MFSEDNKLKINYTYGKNEALFLFKVERLSYCD